MTMTFNQTLQIHRDHRHLMINLWKKKYKIVNDEKMVVTWAKWWLSHDLAAQRLDGYRGCHPSCSCDQMNVSRAPAWLASAHARLWDRENHAETAVSVAASIDRLKLSARECWNLATWVVSSLAVRYTRYCQLPARQANTGRTWGHQPEQIDPESFSCQFVR